MKIHILRDTETIRYAADELKKYAYMMCGIDAEISADEGEIKLGLLSDLSLSEEGNDDPMIDDVIDISVSGFSGHIAGSNGRSVLMGVYNYLKSAGAMWVRPGVNGEFIPNADLLSHSFDFRKKADYSFRGECIEGAVSYEHLRDTVEWLPNVNMNFFMIAFTGVRRWCSQTPERKPNTLLPLCARSPVPEGIMTYSLSITEISPHPFVRMQRSG